MKISKREILFWTIIVINAIAFLFGTIHFYGDRFFAYLFTEPWSALALIDCPLAALFVAVSLILIRMGQKYDLLYYLTMVAAFKYGLWTMFVLVSYNSTYYYYDPVWLFINFVGHMGLFLESFLFLGKIKIQKFFILVAVILFLVNDFMDYFLGTAPPMPELATTFMYQFTVFLTFAGALLCYYLLTRYFSPIADVFEE